jgi:hypothetical protein
VIDVLSRRLARLFKHAYPCDAHATCLEFANDGKWLISADSKGVIKVLFFFGFKDKIDFLGFKGKIDFF